MEAEGSHGGTEGHCGSLASLWELWEALWKVKGSAAGWRPRRREAMAGDTELRTTSLGN